MSTLTLFHLGGRWLALDGSRLVAMPAYPKLDVPVVVVSDFDNALTGVMAMEANASMAAPLIERRLRKEGMVEGETRLEIAHSISVGRGFQALYSAIPMTGWQRLLSWAESCEEHCIIVPLLSVAKRLQNPGQAVVLRHGRQVTFLGVQNDNILYAETMAYSNDADGVLASVNSLADRVRALLVKGARPRSVVWYALDAAADHDDQKLAADFGKALGLEVQLANHPTLTLTDGGQARSALPLVAKAINTADAVTSRFSSVLFRAERFLPWAAAASVLLALGLLALGGYWYKQSNEQLQQAQLLRTDADRMTGETQALLAELKKDNGEAERSRQFIERLAVASEDQDMSSTLEKVHQAAQNWVSILRLRKGETDQRLYVEGAIDKGPNGARNLALFIANLRAVGFDPVAVDPPPGTQSAEFFSYALQPMGTTPPPEKL
jgi:hypothetical protein